MVEGSPPTLEFGEDELAERDDRLRTCAETLNVGVLAK
jgi:hypothetical protein